MKEEGRRKKEEGRRKKVYISGYRTPTQNEPPAFLSGIKPPVRIIELPILLLADYCVNQNLILGR
jgi:hypothetical protein